ncbi:MAG: Hsp20/alpha crystallin family protein [Nocardioides sp.]|nr:Hsp20/alpha crystallin family protein [Nocardioides sp.]
MNRQPVQAALSGQLADKLVDLAPGESVPVREYRDATRWIIEADLPGFDPVRDIEVVVRETSVLIKARHHVDSHPATRPGHGNRHQVVSIPAGVVPEDITTKYAGGVLTLSMPLPATRRPSRRQPGLSVP